MKNHFIIIIHIRYSLPHVYSYTPPIIIRYLALERIRNQLPRRNLNNDTMHCRLSESRAESISKGTT